MSLRPLAYTGAVAPEGVAITVKRSTGDIDLTTVTGATIQVRKPDGRDATWTAQLSGATTDTIVVTHVFNVDGKDLDMSGDYKCYPVLTVPGGTVRGRPKVLRVLEPFCVDDPQVGTG